MAVRLLRWYRVTVRDVWRVWQGVRRDLGLRLGFCVTVGQGRRSRKPHSAVIAAGEVVLSKGRVHRTIRLAFS